MSPRILVVLLFGLLCLPLAAESGWVTLTPEGHRCSFSMPGKPSEKSSSLKTKLGEVPQKQYILATRDAAFVVALVEYPAARLKGLDPQSLLEGAVQGSLSNGGKVVQQKKLVLKGFPGREVTYRKGDVVIRARLYLVGNRLYQTLVAAQEKRSKQPDVQKFLDSFQLK
ncbi:MAG: hypothetical protein AB1758_14665 [Candidatus Eremiobacterota bacterium]